MLNVELLRSRISNGESFEYLLFWGHQPSKNGKASKACLSQWFECSFVINDITYQTAEHWIMAAKARLFGDDEVLANILKSSDPKTAKALGRTVKNFDDEIWIANARQLVIEGNLAKFAQNQEIKTFLLATGKTVLVEASPNDRIWGIGLMAGDERAKNPMTWQGQNLLGFALMNVREQLAESKGDLL